MAETYYDSLRNAILSWRTSEWVSMRPKRLREQHPELVSAEVDDDIIRCAWVLDRAYRGTHHVPRGVMVRRRFIEVHHHGDMATADADLLTRLVIAAHDAAVRVEVSPGMRHVRIMLHPRARTPSNMTNHRTMESAVAIMRDGGAACPVAAPERPLG